MKYSLAYCALLVVSSILAAAQGEPVVKGEEKPSAQGTPQPGESTEPVDTLGRSTPQGTVLGFLQSAQSGKYKQAAQYLELSKRERAIRGERLAFQLHKLMDSAFVGRVGAITGYHDRSAEVGGAENYEHIGVFRINETETSVDLVHVADPQSGEIWLFSSKLLAQVLDLFKQIEGNEMESKLPGFLRVRVFGTTLGRWLALVLLIPLSLGLSWVVVRPISAGLSFWQHRKPLPVLEDIRSSLPGPAMLILTVVFLRIGMHFLGAPLLIRVYFQRFTGLVLVGGLSWLLFRLINLWGERARARALQDSGYSSGSLFLLGQRVLKVFVVVVAVLTMLSLFGFDMTTVLAGLGIGSIAVAFAAQKTLENLIGGISILGDEVIRVGESCIIAGKEGVVEDISLRSTRLRMVDRTVLSVPNGQLANMNIENISRRDKRLFQARLGLRYETSPDQLRALLTEIRTLLLNHPKVDRQVARARFVAVAESSLDIDVAAMILTRDPNEFLAIREELLLGIVELTSAAGAEFAVRRTQAA